MKLIGKGVNTELSDLIIDNAKESFDWNLVHQLHKIMVCWDALFDEGRSTEKPTSRMYVACQIV
jgi:hypothetical protein